MAKKIAYILGKFPGVPPFVFNEIKEIKIMGFDVTLFSVNNPKGKIIEDEWTDITFYVKNYIAPRVVFSHVYYLFNKPQLYMSFLLGNKKFGGLPVFWKSVYYAYIIKKKKIKHIHAHFAWDAADVAMIVSKFCVIPYSITAHQSDIHRNPVRLFQKLANAKFILTCTKGNEQYFSVKFGPHVKNKTYTVYHGIDPKRFDGMASANGKDIDVLGIGSLLEFKGFNYLIDACKILVDQGLDLKFVVIGKGERRKYLEEKISSLGLENYVWLIGYVPYENIKEYYSRAKIFSLPVIMCDGSPHGIPNVIAEAMAMRLPVVVTNVPHIPELVVNNETGFMVPENDTFALAKAIGKLLDDDELREIIGQKAREKIISDFNFKKNIENIAGFITKSIKTS